MEEERLKQQKVQDMLNQLSENQQKHILEVPTSIQELPEAVE